MSIVNPSEQIHDPLGGAKGISIGSIKVDNQPDLTFIREEQGRIETEIIESQVFPYPQGTCKDFLQNEYNFAMATGTAPEEERKQLYDLLKGNGNPAEYLQKKAKKYFEDGQRNIKSSIRSVQQFGERQQMLSTGLERLATQLVNPSV